VNRYFLFKRRQVESWRSQDGVKMVAHFVRSQFQ